MFRRMHDGPLENILLRDNVIEDVAVPYAGDALDQVLGLPVPPRQPNH